MVRAQHLAMPYPEIGKPLPRAADAYAEDQKWRGWILAPVGHGAEWERIFRIGLEDRAELWMAIAESALSARVSTVRDRMLHGVTCGVRAALRLNDRTGFATTVWHYDNRAAAPRLVTAYPTT